MIRPCATPSEGYSISIVILVSDTIKRNTDKWQFVLENFIEFCLNLTTPRSLNIFIDFKDIRLISIHCLYIWLIFLSLQQIVCFVTNFCLVQLFYRVNVYFIRNFSFILIFKSLFLSVNVTNHGERFLIRNTLQISASIILCFIHYKSCLLPLFLFFKLKLNNFFSQLYLTTVEKCPSSVLERYFSTVV